MRCHGPGCGGSPHDIEHRYFSWSGGARACDRRCLAAVRIPDNQRKYDIQHGLVDIVAHTMTITKKQAADAVAAARLGDTEDSSLAARYDQARELLWTAPCDLTAAADAVNRFQQAVLAVGAQRL